MVTFVCLHTESSESLPVTLGHSGRLHRPAGEICSGHDGLVAAVDSNKSAFVVGSVMQINLCFSQKTPLFRVINEAN